MGNIKQLRMLITCLALLASPSLHAQNTDKPRLIPTPEERARATTEPRQSKGYTETVVIGEPSWVPRDMEDLVAKSEIVVEAFVVSRFPSTYVSGHLFTDVELQVVRTIRGSADFPLMNPGDHFILFLNPETPKRASYLPIRDDPRYAIVGNQFGALPIVDERLSLGKPFPAGFQKTFSGMNSQEAFSRIEEINAQFNTQR
jgi:hypothetical protein